MQLVTLALAAFLAGSEPLQAQDSCTIHARILGHDGRPLPRARAFPIEPNTRSIRADRQGNVAIRLTCGDARVFVISGVHHEDLELPLIGTPGRSLEVEIRLRPQAWVGRYDSVRVIGDFNDYSAKTAIPMTRRRDGTFVALVPCKTESLQYQLLGVAKDGLPTGGTLADTFQFRARRTVSSIHAGGEPVEVVFDPRRLPQSRQDARVRFGDPRSRSALIYPLYQRVSEEEHRLGAAHQAHLANGADPDSFRWDWSAFSGVLKSRMAIERDSLRRQFLLLSFVRRPTFPDSAFARRALTEVAPDSPLWSLIPGGPSGALWNVLSATRDTNLFRRYAERGSVTHPDREMRATFLSAAMHMAQASGDQDRLGRYYTRMMAEFSGTSCASIARKQFAPDRATRMGQPAPDFAFSSLEDSTKVVRVADFRGHFMLIDFWAVWCGPCRGEMPSLHRAWEEFRDRGLVIVSISFDERREDVARYRADKWPMPWLHAFAKGGFGSREGAAFEVWGIPKPLLIGPDGSIVADEDGLRGEKLHETLTRLLAGARADAVRKD